MRQCNKCGESVIESKAFCPGCGSAMDEERSGETANLDGTMQFGQTMYNQMIADMGLDLSTTERSRTPEPEPQPSATPSATPVILKPAARPPTQEVILKPAAASAPAVATDRPKSNLWKWLIAIGVIVVLFGILLIIAAAAIFFFYLPRTP